jgi:hypothetical protein
MTSLESAAAPLSRRAFLQTSSAVLASLSAAAEASTAEQKAWIDTNISLGHWPFRQHRLAEPAALVEKLLTQGITEAWAGSFDALLHKDISSVNDRLAADCQKHGPGFLRPMAALNPTLPGWEEDLRRVVEVHDMPGIRLHPNYHGYALDDPRFERVLSLATETRRLVQIAVIMEEERTIHSRVNVPATDTAPLTTILQKHPQLKVQLLNAFRTIRGLSIASLAKLGVSFEIAMLEGVNGVANLLEKLPAEQLCFGSHAPFFYFESAKLKLQESDLTPAQLNALRSSSARRLSGGS